MKAASERGQIGAWAYEARADADLSVEEVAERLTRSGNGVTAATIRGIEGGSKKPSRRLLRALAKVYDRPAPGDAEADEGRENLVGLSDLASAISALVEELRLSREARLDLQERVEALETAAKLQGRPIAGAAGAPTAPVQTG